MTEGKLIDVTVQVLGTHVVIDAVMAAREKRSEALNPVGVSFVADILANRMIDANMIEALSREADIAAVLIRNHG